MVVIKPCPFIPKLIKVLFQLKSLEHIILNTRGENRQENVSNVKDPKTAKKA